ncbi:hypothetical protein CLOM_g1588 [Closterium sp. NIES-68]|nr:hypothetical protein CLOM_g1588 [Closterium sp. NIES-68]
MLLTTHDTVTTRGVRFPWSRLRGKGGGGGGGGGGKRAQGRKKPRVARDGCWSAKSGDTSSSAIHAAWAATHGTSCRRGRAAEGMSSQCVAAAHATCSPSGGPCAFRAERAEQSLSSAPMRCALLSEASAHGGCGGSSAWVTSEASRKTRMASGPGGLPREPPRIAAIVSY